MFPSLRAYMGLTHFNWVGLVVSRLVFPYVSRHVVFWNQVVSHCVGYWIFLRLYISIYIRKKIMTLLYLFLWDLPYPYRLSIVFIPFGVWVFNLWIQLNSIRSLSSSDLSLRGCLNTKSRTEIVTSSLPWWPGFLKWVGTSLSPSPASILPRCSSRRLPRCLFVWPTYCIRQILQAMQTWLWDIYNINGVDVVLATREDIADR